MEEIDNSVITITKKELEQLKRDAEQYVMLKQKADQASLDTHAVEIGVIKHDLEKLSHACHDINIIKHELEKMKRDFAKQTEEFSEYKNKLNNITKSRVKKRNVEDMDLMEKFFRDHLVAKKGSSVKTVDVMTKANDILSEDGIRFNKFEVAKFMKDKGITKKKSGGHSYYQDIKFV